MNRHVPDEFVQLLNIAASVKTNSVQQQERLRKDGSDFTARANVYCAWFNQEMPFSMSSDARDVNFAYQVHAEWS